MDLARAQRNFEGKSGPEPNSGVSGEPALLAHDARKRNPNEASMLGLRGYVQTPERVVNHTVAKLFKDKPPKADDRVLDAGCGKGEFIEGIILWCKKLTILFPK
jgi:hypothetical protein